MSNLKAYPVNDTKGSTADSRSINVHYASEIPRELIKLITNPAYLYDGHYLGKKETDEPYDKPWVIRHNVRGHHPQAS